MPGDFQSATLIIDASNTFPFLGKQTLLSPRAGVLSARFCFLAIHSLDWGKCFALQLERPR